jgi:hypothetical protein
VGIHNGVCFKTQDPSSCWLDATSPFMAFLIADSRSSGMQDRSRFQTRLYRVQHRDKV